MGALWVWLAGFALIVAIIVLVPTGNPWVAAIAAAAILVGWALVTVLNCWIECARR